MEIILDASKLAPLSIFHFWKYTIVKISLEVTKFNFRNFFFNFLCCSSNSKISFEFVLDATLFMIYLGI